MLYDYPIFGILITRITKYNVNLKKKMLKYGIMFIDILTFLLDYRDALLITLYVLCCPSNPKNQINWIIIKIKSKFLKNQ